MAKRIKQRKGLDRQANRLQEDVVMEQASPSSAWDAAAFFIEPNHELDPDGDLVLILNPSSFGYKNAVHGPQSEGMVKLNRLEVRHYFN